MTAREKLGRSLGEINNRRVSLRGAILLLIPTSTRPFRELHETVLLRWDNTALQGVLDSKLTAPTTSRALAIMPTCMSDAWAAYDEKARGTQLSGALRRPASERTRENKQRAISYAAIDLSPFAVAVGGTTGETFYENSNTGYQYGASASWNSSSTSIATVNTSGVVTGVSTGSLTLYGNDLYAETDGVGWYCTDIYFYCPTSYFNASTVGSSASPPSVTFSNINYVVVGQTATITAAVTPSNNSIPISLSISSAATIVTPTGTFKSTTPVVVKGLTVGNAILTATISNADGSKMTVGSTSFPVTSAAPSAIVTLRTSGTVSSDDSALAAYRTDVGTTSLGPFITTTGATEIGCLVGNETVGTITPSNYTGMVQLHRLLLSDYVYENSTPYGTPETNVDDTSGMTLRDDNPQSGGSAGKVYSMDAPGQTPQYVDGNTYRFRANFAADAELPDGTRISPYYYYYVRVSCTKTSTGFQFVNDVPGDNTIGTGTTATSWNLQ